MRLVCAPVKAWPPELHVGRPVDLYEFDHGDEKRIYDKQQNLCFVSIDVASAPRSENNIMVTYHNFDETPDLEKVFAKMKQKHSTAAKYKIAVFANSTLDALKVLQFQQKHPDVIALAMGEKGVVTRVMSPFTYAPLTEHDKTAPGQLLWSELDTIYHYRSIGPQTRLYALIGDPVSQSIGHLYHNDQFRQKGIDAVYVKMVVKPEEVSDFFQAIKGLPFWGFSVTSPLKEKINDQITNTLYRTPDGWKSCNTDGVAVAEILGDVAGKKIVILGRGGAAKAIEMALTPKGAQVILLGRHMEIPHYDVLINATSSPNPEFQDHFIPGKIVMDIRMRTSPFLLRAKASGSISLDGLPMFFSQAEGQQAVWQESAVVCRNHA